MKVLLVGNGGREHALAWRIAQSPSLTRLWVAPGNYGTADIAINLSVGGGIEALVDAARDVAADLVVVGPEAPLAAGLTDAMTAVGIPVFGPSRAAARLESSKSFAREVIRAADAPGPDFDVFTEESEALKFLRCNPGPRVVKADGLAAGKGVVVCDNASQAAEAVRTCMSGRAFGEAGATVLLEERIEGREVSVFAFCDGERLSPLVAACDYKRVNNGDDGPNTGGMGSYSPPEFWTTELSVQVERAIVRPVISRNGQAGHPLQRGTVRWLDAYVVWAEDPGVQLPLRRPGNAGVDAPPGHRSSAGDAGLRPGESGPGVSGLERPPLCRRGDGVARVPSQLRDGLRDFRPRCPG